MVHCGTFLPGYRTADTFLKGLRQALNTQPSIAERLEVLFVGKIGEEASLIESLSLSGLVKQTGYLPHHESLASVMGADLLLLIGGTEAWEETGKIYEYVASRRPILAIVRPDGEAARLLRHYPAAQVVDREDVQGVCNAILNFDRRLLDNLPHAEPNWLEQFDRKRLTGRLASLFERVVHPSEADDACAAPSEA
jgi:glycosyltransferase involved in cell wall biosynthesis